MQRWIARFLVLVMAVPALGPVALASVAQTQAPHCVRSSAKPVMPCHPGMHMAAEPSSETSFGAVDSCCQNHSCCRGMATPQWAQTQSRVLVHQGASSTETARILAAKLLPTVLTDDDSARAPPRK